MPVAQGTFFVWNVLLPAWRLLHLPILRLPFCLLPPCRLQSSKLTALEYTLSSWVVPVSIIMSLLGCWASGYHLVAKWTSVAHGGSWGCNLLQPL